MKMFARRSTLIVILASSLLMACHPAPPPAPPPQEITRSTVSSLDGMSLMDYPGPKAQIIYDQGAPDFFCDTVGLVAVYLHPEQQKQVLALYVQDMGKTDWTHPQGHWINAKTAFYVVGSKLLGSMGPTFASFAQPSDARNFAAKHGGKVIRFDQFTPEMAVMDGGVVKDKSM